MKLKISEPKLVHAKTPVLMFFESYYKPETVTTGFDSTLKIEEWNEEKTSLTYRASFGEKHPIALICLAAKGRYSFFVNGKAVSARRITQGAYEIDVPRGEATVTVSEAPFET